MAFLQVENLSFTYPTAKVKALDEVCFSLEKGSFNLLIGRSGCGKSTLLRLLKPQISPFGQRSGTALLENTPLNKLGFEKIGFVGQRPEEQLVTDKVWHELAFGLENMGLSQQEIYNRVGEICNYFGMGEWYHKPTATLSGGQKQLLNLAAVTVMQPQLLILDEPTAQLDPIAAANFISTLKKLNRELGITVLLCEHRLEEVFSVDRILALQDGKLIFNGTPKACCGALKNNALHAGFPAAVRLWQSLNLNTPCPVTVVEGRRFLDTHFSALHQAVPKKSKALPKTPVLEAKGLYFSYDRAEKDVLRGLDFTLCKGELFSLIGGNGSGKTTLLHVLAGLQKPYRGRYRVLGQKLSAYTQNSLYRGHLALLPQDPVTVFVKPTLKEDFEEILAAASLPKEQHAAAIEKVAEQFEITPFLSKNPLDLSGGEQQRCALAKLLLTNPEIILLDEPTKGMDAETKNRFGCLLQKMQQAGKTVLTVTHDIEFAAAFSTRCGLFFDGRVVSSNEPNAFFAQNCFYTTAACRMAKEHVPNAVLVEEVAAVCQSFLNGEV